MHTMRPSPLHLPTAGPTQDTRQHRRHANTNGDTKRETLTCRPRVKRKPQPHDIADGNASSQRRHPQSNL